MKYRIIEYENGFGEIKYRVQEKRFLRWSSVEKFLEFFMEPNLHTFDSIEQAKTYMEKRKEREKKRNLRVKSVFYE